MSGTWTAGRRRGRPRDCRCGRGRQSRARAISPADQPRDPVTGSGDRRVRRDRRASGSGPKLLFAAATIAPLADLAPMGEGPADDQEQDEVDDADRVRVQVAELLADLAIDL